MEFRGGNFCDGEPWALARWSCRLLWSDCFLIGHDLTWFQSLGCPTFSVSSIKIGGTK